MLASEHDHVRRYLPEAHLCKIPLPPAASGDCLIAVDTLREMQQYSVIDQKIKGQGSSRAYERTNLGHPAKLLLPRTSE